MLCLNRKAGQSISVDGPAVITITKVAGGRVRVAVEAAASTKILRGELVAIETQDNNSGPAAGPESERAA